MPTGGRHEHARAWDAGEDDKIRAMVLEHGPRWSMIAEALCDMGFEERSTSAIRNRFSRIVKAERLVQQGVEPRNLCGRCGQKKRGHTCRAKSSQLINASTSPDLAPGGLYGWGTSEAQAEPGWGTSEARPEPGWGTSEAQAETCGAATDMVDAAGVAIQSAKLICSASRFDESHYMRPPLATVRGNFSFSDFLSDYSTGIAPPPCGPSPSFMLSTFLNDQNVDLSLPDGLSFSQIMDMTVDESADAL